MAGFLGTVSGSVRLNIKQAVAAYATVRAQNARTVYALRGTGEAFQSAGKGMIVAGAGLLYIFGKVVQAAGDFERKMDFAASIMGTTQKETQRLSDFVLQLAQDTIYSADEVADGMIELAKAGATADQIIGGVGKAVTDLGAAADIPLEQAGQIIVSTIGQYNLAAKDAVRITNLIAGAANASIVNVDDLGVSLKYVGGVADAMGVSFKDTITVLAELGKAGIRGSTAGTSLRQMLVSLAGATDVAKEEMKTLGIITKDGTNRFFDQHGKLKSLDQVFQILQDHTKGLTQQEKILAYRTIFNNRALAAAAILTREGKKGFQNMWEAMSKTRAADVAHDRLDNLSGDIEILKGNIQTFMVEAGTPFQETLRGWVQALTKVVQAFGKLDPKTQKLIFQFIGITGAVLVAMGIISYIIGTIFKFIVAIYRLTAGIRFLSGLIWSLIKGIFGLLRGIVTLGGRLGWVARGFALLWDVIVGLVTILAAALGVTVGVAAAIVAAVVAVIAIFVILYLRVEAVRDAVNDFVGAIWNAIEAMGQWMALLFTDPGKAFAQLRDAGLDAIQALIQGFLNLPGLILRALGFLLRVGAQAAGLLLQGLAALPGLLIQFFTSMVGRLIGIALTLFGRLLSTIGTILRRLPYIIGYVLGFAIGTFVRLTAQFIVAAVRFATRLVSTIARFLARLPGIIARLITAGAAAFARGMVNMIHAAATNAPRIISNIVDFFVQLPGRIAHWMANALVRFIAFIPRFTSNAVELGFGILDTIVNWIEQLPDAMGDILHNMIDIIRGLISEAFQAVQDFASGMWDGFKAGLGIGSPSYMERAMWQISDVMTKETDRLAKKTMAVQKMSTKLGRTQFKMPDVPVDDYKKMIALQKQSDAARRRMGLAGQAPDITRNARAAVISRRQQAPTKKEFNLYQDVHNPIPETPTTTAVKRITRVAQLGLLSGALDNG